MPKITVKDLFDSKGKTQLIEVEIQTAGEARACKEAGINMLFTAEQNNVSSIRTSAPDAFLTVGLAHGEYFTKAEVKKAAFALIRQGANAIYCPVNQKWVEALSEEGIPAIGHVGMNPETATWTGGTNPVAQSAKEAFQLYKAVRSLRSSGAFAVRMELAPAKVAEEISKRTNILVLSRGSGGKCDGQSLTATDLLGSNIVPSASYTKQYRDHASEYARLHKDSTQAFAEFKKDVEKQAYPLEQHKSSIAQDEFETFMYALEKALAKKS